MGWTASVGASSCLGPSPPPPPCSPGLAAAPHILRLGGSCLWALGGRGLVVLVVTLGDTQRLSAGASLTGSGWPHCPGNVWPTRVCRTSEPGRSPAPGTGDGGLVGAHGCRCCDGHSEQACVRFARSRGVSLSASQKEEGRTFTPEHSGPRTPGHHAQRLIPWLSVPRDPRALQEEMVARARPARKAAL